MIVVLFPGRMCSYRNPNAPGYRAATIVPPCATCVAFKAPIDLQPLGSVRGTPGGRGLHPPAILYARWQHRFGADRCDFGALAGEAIAEVPGSLLTIPVIATIRLFATDLLGNNTASLPRFVADYRG